MKTKVCTKCLSEYPKTTDYFFAKIIKQKLSNGETAIYNTVRSNCKKCHGENGGKRRVKKRCKELNCDVSNYRAKWKDQYTKTRTLHPEAKDKLTESQYNVYCQLFNKGEVSNFIDYLYRIEAKKRTQSKRCIKNTSYKKIQNYRNEYYKEDRKKLKDSYVSNNLLGFKVGEVPKDMIQTKRLLMQLTRELNKN